MNAARSRRKPRERHESERRADAYDRLEKKLASGPLGEEAWELVPREGVKMSEVLEEFIAPYRQYAEDDASYRKLLSLAVAAWNLSFLSYRKRREQLETLVTTLGATERDRQAFRDIMRAMIRRKRLHFLHHRRMIVEYDLEDMGDMYHLTVASAPFGEGAEEHEED